MPKTINVGTFTKSILLEIGRRKGHFETNGFLINEVSVHSSPSLFESLESGQLHVAITNPDNVLAYRFLTENPLRRKLNMKILAAIDRGLNLSLCASPAYQKNSSASGFKFGVDVASSGFAFVGYALLDRQGFQRTDFTIETLGSTPKRAQALIENEVDITVLNAGNEIRAISEGCLLIDDISSLGAYIGSVVSSMCTPNGSVDPDLLQFADLLLEISNEIISGQHKESVIEIACKNLALTPVQAVEHYRTLLDSKGGLISSGIVDKESIATLINLRHKYQPTNELELVMTSLDSLVEGKYLL